MSNTITVGILGAALNNGNLGVNALGFCLLDATVKTAARHEKNVKCLFFSTDRKEDIDLYVRELGIQDYEIHLPISLKKPPILLNFIRAIASCDLVIDITGGDSFSDIYGNNRFIRETVGKFIAEAKSRILLAPQTIGPFSTAMNAHIAALAINKAGVAFARDTMSYEYTKKIARKTKVVLTSDLAFELPYDSTPRITGDGLKIGLNISALMWNGGYNRSNQFGLTVDYKAYVYGLMEQLRKIENATVYLIPHVVHQLDVENDFLVCREIHEKYPETVLLGPFKTPMEAKSYIKDMDVFMGGRMHSTIAAASTGVAVIPVSYSRKFEGLYHSIGYTNLVNCGTLDTQSAIDQTMELIQQRERLTEEVRKSAAEAKGRLQEFYSYLDGIISAL